MKVFLTVFITVFLAELGDKTQLATLLYASEAANPRLTVFLASTAALATSAGLAVLLGGQICRLVQPRYLSMAAGIGFIGIGAWTLASSLSANCGS